MLARVSRYTAAPLGNPITGSKGSKTCRHCLRAMSDARTVVRLASVVVRIRFGVPQSELPDLPIESLGRFLNFLLLQGKERDSVAFPRAQRTARDKDGLCTLQRLCRRSRWELAHSLNSIKRNLGPLKCRQHTPSAFDEWFHQRTTLPPPPSQQYLSFVKGKVSELFPHGWDRKYASFVNSHVPRASARLPLLSRGDLEWQGNWKGFRGACLSGTTPQTTMRARYKEVLSTGKTRPLLIYEKRTDVLAPLHKCLYKHLSDTTDWLLVGPPTAERISSVCVNEHQTSVDLVSATDNLSLAVTDIILSGLFRTASKIPHAVRAFALDSQFPDVYRKGKHEGRIMHGQMMGGYLSFPLLCIHSYLMAAFAVRDQPGSRFLVNGDDTIISSIDEVPTERYPPGVQLNDGKTIRAMNVAEVNSTVFIRESGKWRQIRHLRRGGCITDFAGILHFAKACKVAGRIWEEAFVKSRIGKKWGFLPSELGLDCRSYVVWKRQAGIISMGRVQTPLLAPDMSPSVDLVRRDGVPSSDERLALTDHLYTNGRAVEGKWGPFNPSRGETIRSRTYIKSRRCWRQMSYRCHLVSARVGKEQKRKTEGYYVPAEYGRMRKEWGRERADRNCHTGE